MKIVKSPFHSSGFDPPSDAKYFAKILEQTALVKTPYYNDDLYWSPYKMNGELNCPFFFIEIYPITHTDWSLILTFTYLEFRAPLALGTINKYILDKQKQHTKQFLERAASYRACKLLEAHCK